MKKTHGSTSFMALGACRDSDPEMFEEELTVRLRTRRRFARALLLCRGCPVRDQCLLWGMQNRETGIWGGRYLISGKDHPLR